MRSRASDGGYCRFGLAGGLRGSLGRWELILGGMGRELDLEVLAIAVLTRMARLKQVVGAVLVIVPDFDSLERIVSNMVQSREAELQT